MTQLDGDDPVPCGTFCAPAPDGWFNKEGGNWAAVAKYMAQAFFFISRSFFRELRKTEFGIIWILLAVAFVIGLIVDIILACMLLVIFPVVAVLIIVLLILLVIISMVLGCCLFYHPSRNPAFNVICYLRYIAEFISCTWIDPVKKEDDQAEKSV
jgi:hypothetical protein